VKARQPIRRCGKQYATEEEAFRSKAGQKPGAEVTSCRCGRFHLTFPPAPRSDGKPRASVSGNTIPPKVCKQVDKRDGRQCVRCGSRQNPHRHHRRIKGHGGDSRSCTDCACNIVTLCTEHHAWAHSGAGRKEAEAEGLIIPRSVTEPWRHGVMVHSEADSGATRWPTCDGEYADEPLERAA
jgi:hypothetical protein